MEGMLIIEIYEYSKNSSLPVFEYIPCDLSKCMKGRSATLKDIINRGFDDVPRKAQNTDKRNDVLQKLEEANIGRINVVYHNVVYHKEKGASDACVELTNVIPITMSYADARRMQSDKNIIILKGQYKLSEGNEITILRDAQRLTLSYSNYVDDTGDIDNAYGIDADEMQKEICLNITFLQDRRRQSNDKMSILRRDF